MTTTTTAMCREPPSRAEVLTEEALDFVRGLHREFNPRRKALLSLRRKRRRAIDEGTSLGFEPRTKGVREASWQVAPCPADLLDRRVEITGPADRKLMVNALNSGAKVFMADFEDALAPTWENVIEGQKNLMDAVRGTLRFDDPMTGKKYELGDELATLLVRPRGWHLDEGRVELDGEPACASLFDFGLYMWHNARERLERGTAPYFYLPKLENHLEAQLWNEVFDCAQDALAIPRGTIRATVLIETIHAAMEMDEILYALRDHASGLNAGRWDYIFSVIKTYSGRSDKLLPGRAQITMTVPFMRAYTELLVKTCHRRGAHAIGGMAAFVPNRRDPEATEVALSRVAEDKRREAHQGFDGTWVAHPDLVGTAMAEFDAVLCGRPHQRDRQRDEVEAIPEALTDTRIDGGTIDEAAVRANIKVALQYLDAWLSGQGAVAIDNLMEDVATAEICRAQLWQWVQHQATLDDGRTMTMDLYERFKADELARCGGRNLKAAANLLDDLVDSLYIDDFLTLKGQRFLA